MERLIFRSTSLSHLQAELRQRELLAGARRQAEIRSAHREGTGLRGLLTAFGLLGRSLG